MQEVEWVTQQYTLVKWSYKFQHTSTFHVEYTWYSNFTEQNVTRMRHDYHYHEILSWYCIGNYYQPSKHLHKMYIFIGIYIYMLTNGVLITKHLGDRGNR